jgi:DNA-binding beta-propeller fold protein YncE
MKTVNILILALASLLGCYQEQPKNEPELSAVFFPGSVLSVNRGQRVFVANTSFDRTFDRGHISVLSPEGTLDTSNSVLTGIFGGQMSISDDGMGDERVLLLPTREEDLIEVYGVGQDGGGSLRLIQTLDTFGRLPMAIGPMSSVWSDGYFLVGHGSGRTVSAWSLDTERNEIEYGCSITLPTGVHFLARHPATGEIYVTSRFSGSVAVLRLEDAGWVGDPSTRRCRLNVARYFDSGAANTHAITFGADGAQLFVTSIIDGTITVLDTRPDGAGMVEERVRRRRWIGPEAGVVKVSPYDGLLYIANAELKRFFQLDPATLSVLKEAELSGRPFDFDFVKDEEGQQRAMMSFFADHEIGIVAIEPLALREIIKVGASE